MAAVAPIPSRRASGGESPLPQGNRLNGIWGSGANDVWAVGDSGTIVHWNGTAWSIVASGTTKNLHGVWGSVANDVWAVGAGGTILRWNGSAWSQVASPTTNGLTDIWGFGADVVYVAAGDKVLRWTGSQWLSVLSGLPGTVYEDVWGSSASDLWVLNGADRNFARFNGTSWSSVSAGVANPLFAVWGTGASDIWAIGNDTARWNGGWWEEVTNTDLLYDAWGTGTSNVWAVGFNGRIQRWNGTAWAAESSGTTSTLKAIWGTGAADVWGPASARSSSWWWTCSRPSTASCAPSRPSSRSSSTSSTGCPASSTRGCR